MVDFFIVFLFKLDVGLCQKPMSMDFFLGSLLLFDSTYQEC